MTRNMIRFESGKGRYGIQLLHGSTRATLEGNTIVIDNGPAIEIDEASLKGFKSLWNFYAMPDRKSEGEEKQRPPGKLIFSYKGEEMDLDSWRAATGQDRDSRVMVAAPRENRSGE